MKTDKSKPLNSHFYTSFEGAELIGISISAFYECCRKRQLPYYRIGKKILCPKVAFDKWLAGDSISLLKGTPNGQ